MNNVKLKQALLMSLNDFMHVQKFRQSDGGGDFSRSITRIQNLIDQVERCELHVRSEK